LNIAAAGTRLIDLSESYSELVTDRAGLRDEIENALVPSRRPRRDSLIEFQAISM
jgi:hypothetical protein